MDAKAGDIVHVRGVVTCEGPDWLVVDFTVNHQVKYNHNVPKAGVVHVEPRPIAAGDTVCWTSRDSGPHEQRMHVNAIVDGRAWCRSAGYDYIKPVSELERVR